MIRPDNPIKIYSPYSIKVDSYIEKYGVIDKLTFLEFVGNIEHSLTNIVETLFDSSLAKIKDISYFVTGGKALNTIVPTDILEKSFDYDIHCKTEQDVMRLMQTLTAYLNEKINQPNKKYIKLQIFNILKNIGVVEDADAVKQLYITCNDFFYYGDRYAFGVHNPGSIDRFSIKSNFMKLYVSKHAFRRLEKQFIFTNLFNNDPDEDTYKKLRIADEYNIIFIPISDVFVDADLNFGLKVFETPNPIISCYTKNNIIYSGFILNIWNLIKYIFNRHKKFKKNYKKLHKIISYLYLAKCSYYDLEQYHADYKNLQPQIMKLGEQAIPEKFYIQITEYQQQMPVNIKTSDNNTEQIFDVEVLHDRTAMIIILHKIFSTVQLYTQVIKQTCDKFMVHNIFLEHISLEEDKQYTSNMITILMNNDKKSSYAVYFYIMDLYLLLDTYCVYIENNIRIDSIAPYINNQQLDITITLPNGILYTIKLPEFNYTYDSICANIDKIISRTNRKYDKTVINEEFYVYSFQLLYGVNIINKIILNVSDFKIGDIIQLQHYVSTLLNKDAKIYEAPNKNILFKIKINKNSKCWIYLSAYSNKPTRNTILLQRNSYFVIDKISTFKHLEQELPLFEVSLFDTLEPSIVHSNECVINDNFRYPFYKKYYLNALRTISRIPQYDIIKSIRISLILYLYILYLLGTNCAPEWSIILTPRYILQICIVGLFYLSININIVSFKDYAQKNQLLFSEAEYTKFFRIMDDNLLKFLFTNADNLSSVNTLKHLEFNVFTINYINEAKEIINFAMNLCSLSYDDITLTSYKVSQTGYTKIIVDDKDYPNIQEKNTEFYKLYTENSKYCLYKLLEYSSNKFFVIKAMYDLQNFDVRKDPKMGSKMSVGIEPEFFPKIGSKIDGGGIPDDERNVMDNFTDYINHSTNNLYCSKSNQISTSTKNINTITRINCALFMNTNDKKISIEDYNDFLQTAMMKNILQSGGNNKKLYFGIKSLF